MFRRHMLCRYVYRRFRLLWHSDGLRFIKIAFLTFVGHRQHGLFVLAAALTFYTLMSLVPIVALIFAIVKGFGIDTALMGMLYDSFPQFSDLLDYVLGFAQNMLARTRGGLVAGVGLVVLFWAVHKVFSNTKGAFDRIWEVEQPRSVIGSIKELMKYMKKSSPIEIVRRYCCYLAAVIAGPMLWAGCYALNVKLENSLLGLTGGAAVDILFFLLNGMLLALVFTLVYWLLPGTRVKFRPALMAGIFAGMLFLGFQKIYLWIQQGLISYNAIYGSFAALPLFLIWMRGNWAILLLGCELSFACQNIERFEQEQRARNYSPECRRRVMIAVLAIMSRRFRRGEPPLPPEDMAERLDMPVRVVREVLSELTRAKIVVRVSDADSGRSDICTLSREVCSMRLLDAIGEVERCGDDTGAECGRGRAMAGAAAALGRLRGQTEALPENVTLGELEEIACDDGEDESPAGKPRRRWMRIFRGRK